MNDYVHCMTTSETRQRIIKAIRALHEDVGPAATTITAIAERAGVQRLTVYRHFPDEGALIGACSADWREDHPLPEPDAWTGMPDPRERIRAALKAIYAYFRDGQDMLGPVLRDEFEVPELAEVMSPWWEYMCEVAGGLSAGWGGRPESQRWLRAAVGHSLRFETWRTLTGEGLSTPEAAEMMARLVETATGSDGAGSEGD